MSFENDLYLIAKKLSNKASRLDSSEFSDPLLALERASESIGKAWSGSWVGYHSCVYYKSLVEPPPGAHFSKEWGLMDSWSIRGTIGEWQEFRHDHIIDIIHAKAGNPDLQRFQTECREVREFFDEAYSLVISAISTASEDFPSDKFLEELSHKVRELKIFDASDFIGYRRPTGQFMTRDVTALQQGIKTPPHIEVWAKVMAIKHPYIACRELAKFSSQIASHIENKSNKARRDQRVGTNIFIGHGRSLAWKDLKDFIQDRLHLPWDEFNRVPIAGVTNVARLSQMLDQAAFAFLVMTAEDELMDGSTQARMNVIHEAGLFQGRLGFHRAIVLLEDGCTEFSNIEGLGQIRFPKTNIGAVFEQVRQVLERESLLI